MNHIDLFSGIGGFAYAARCVWGNKYKNIIFCDNNRFCQEVIKKNFGKDSLIYGDIRQVNREKVVADTTAKRLLYKENEQILEGKGSDKLDIGKSRSLGENVANSESERRDDGVAKDIGQTTQQVNPSSNEISLPQIDLLTGGFPCFVKGTSILTYNGYKPIESIKKGEKVLTHKGRWRKVTATMQRDNAKIYLIRGQGILPTTTTFEHPYYVNGGKWRTVGELKRGDKICQVIPINKSKDSNTNAFWWLVGRYLADGWRIVNNKKGRVVICCARSESENLAKRIKDAGFNSCKASERTCDKFHITRIGFHKFLEPFGKYAYGKTIPGFVFGLEKDKLQSLLDGYFTGDGCVANNPRGKGSFRRVTTTSKELALGVALLVQKAYGVVASLKSYVPKGKKNIEGRTVNQREMFFVTIPERNKSANISGIYGWKHFRDKQSVGVGTVYNIAVEEDESYVANGAVVHNCQPFSCAGKRQGTDDNRHLWPEMFRVIQEFKPTWVVAENVRGLLTIDKGLVFEQVCLDLEGEGYDVQPFIIPAVAKNAPHRRDRVWFIANRKSTGARKNECGIRGLFDGHIDGEQNIADTNNRGQAKQEEQATGDKQHCRRDSDRYSTDNESWNKNWLEVAGEFCRVDDGVPVKLDGFELSKAGHRVERLKALGNAIVPQVAMEIFKAIKFAEENIKKE